MPRVGHRVLSRVGFPLLRCALAALVVVVAVAVAAPARATMFPPSIRLPLMFGRPLWSGPQMVVSPVPGLVAVEWES